MRKIEVPTESGRYSAEEAGEEGQREAGGTTTATEGGGVKEGGSKTGGIKEGVVEKSPGQKKSETETERQGHHSCDTRRGP